ncbi:MAG: AMP-dependent synthetase/ligase [Pseudomonadota bacterium]
METKTIDAIGTAEAQTLPRLFRRRVERSPEREAYRQYDRKTERWIGYTWAQTGEKVELWRRALAGEGLAAGSRVAILLENGLEWVCMDQAALALGLVTVPLYVTDNPENIAYILGDSGASLLLVGDAEAWNKLAPLRGRFPALNKVLYLRGQADTAVAPEPPARGVDDWLAAGAAGAVDRGGLPGDPDALATIVYTSGTTGRPKGVMLSHRNILSNIEAVLRHVPAYAEDVLLSFLPLSHAFERTAGYYLPIASGSSVAYARSVADLPQDLLTIRPTVLVSVPRIYERVYARLQEQLEEKGPLARALFRWAEEIGWRRFVHGQKGERELELLERMLWPALEHLVADKLLARLGGRLRVAVAGGAALNPKISHCFLAMGLPLLQGYGLTEAAPVVSANRLADNVPESVGIPLAGVEVKIGEQDELLVRGPNVMLGYWQRPEDTRKAIDGEGWLHTGDQARIEDGHIYILGRLKEVMVTSTGEKIAPVDLEMAITADPLFDQAMVVGEGRPFVGALLVLNPAAWREAAESLHLAPDDPAALATAEARAFLSTRVQDALRAFPRYAVPRALWATLEPWTVENGLITPTLKLKRPVLQQQFEEQITALYREHKMAA